MNADDTPGDLAASRAREQRLREAGNALVASLSDVLTWHRDPESSDYNECEKSPCNFCETAGKAIDMHRAALAAQEERPSEPDPYATPPAEFIP